MSGSISKPIRIYGYGDPVEFSVQPNPPEMVRGMDLALAEQWIQAHPEPMRPALAELIEKVSQISFAVFLNALGGLSQQVKNHLNNVRTDVIVLVEARKSNQWVAELAFHYCSFKPKAFFRLGDKNAVAFSRFFEEASVKQIEQVREAFHGKTVVLFDDASFSGKQMLGHIAGIYSSCQKYKIPIRAICVIIPFITKVAREKLLIAQRELDIPLEIAVAEEIESLAGLTPQAVELLSNAWQVSNARELGLSFFSHKVPNSISFPKPLVSASVFDSSGRAIRRFKGRIIPKITPPYKKNFPS